MRDYKLYVKRILLPSLVLILLLMLFLARHFISVNQNYEIKELLSKYKISEEDGFDEYLFSPEEIETAVTVFTDIVIPEYVPERFQMRKLEVFCWGNGPKDEYNAYFYYDDISSEDEIGSLSIKISNKQWGLTNYNINGVIDSVEFEKGFIAYTKDPLEEESGIIKKWMAGESIDIFGLLTREEAEQILEGIPLEF